MVLLLAASLASDGPPNKRTVSTDNWMSVVSTLERVLEPEDGIYPYDEAPMGFRTYLRENGMKRVKSKVRKTVQRRISKYVTQLNEWACRNRALPITLAGMHHLRMVQNAIQNGWPN